MKKVLLWLGIPLAILVAVFLIVDLAVIRKDSQEFQPEDIAAGVALVDEAQELSCYDESGIGWVHVAHCSDGVFDLQINTFSTDHMLARTFAAVVPEQDYDMEGYTEPVGYREIAPNLQIRYKAFGNEALKRVWDDLEEDDYPIWEWPAAEQDEFRKEVEESLLADLEAALKEARRRRLGE